jgi:hypothetical protein
VGRGRLGAASRRRLCALRLPCACPRVDARTSAIILPHRISLRCPIAAHPQLAEVKTLCHLDPHHAGRRIRRLFSIQSG